MRLAPAGLLARVFLLISGIVVLTTAAWLLIFRLADAEPRARELAQLASSNVNLVRAALFAAAPEKRPGLFRELSGREGIRLLPGDPGDTVTSAPEENRFILLVQHYLQQKLGPNTNLALSVNGVSGLWISFQLDEDDEEHYWLMLPGEHAHRNVAWNWLIWGLLSLFVALAGAALIASRITHPLAVMARAAKAIGLGQYPPPLEEDGAVELRTLASAFNRMTRDLAHHEQERAEILAGISHDLRTPLARLRLEVEMSVADPAAQAGMAADIEQMDSVIGQFLDYARSESAEPPLEIDIQSLLQDVVQHQQLITQPITLESTITSRCQVRPAALRRALDNLISNAYKYAPGSDVVLKAYQSDANIVLEVLDRGPGIPIAEIERLKRPFTRLNTARSDTTGTGLGLAIVDRIAKLHGGQLQLLPRPGGGLAVRIQFPLKTL